MTTVLVDAGCRTVWVKVSAGANGAITGAADQTVRVVAGIGAAPAGFGGDGGPAAAALLGLPFGGLEGDVAVPGDYDGDGRADVAIFRPGCPRSPPPPMVPPLPTG